MNITIKGKMQWYICKLLMNYSFREAYFEYFESCNFSCKNTNTCIDVTYSCL